MDRNLGNNNIQDIQQPVKYETDSDNELKVTKKVNLKLFVAGHMHDQVGKISTRSWPVRRTLMFIRLNLKYSKNWLIGVLIAIAYPFLLLR